jgi:Protein of unknown function (DUF2946)
MLSRRASLSGLCLALLALAAQFAVALPRAVAAPVQHCGTLICAMDADADEDAGVPAPAHQHDPSDCPVCPLCVSLTGHSALLVPMEPLLPRPASVLIARAAILPPALAPPAVARRSAQPRAPPFPA